MNKHELNDKLIASIFSKAQREPVLLVGAAISYKIYLVYLLTGRKLQSTFASGKNFNYTADRAVMKRKLSNSGSTRTGPTVAWVSLSSIAAAIIDVNPQLSHLLLQRLQEAPWRTPKSALKSKHDAQTALLKHGEVKHPKPVGLKHLFPDVLQKDAQLSYSIYKS